jgi:hypothetical protein
MQTPSECLWTVELLRCYLSTIPCSISKTTNNQRAYDTVFRKPSTFTTAVVSAPTPAPASASASAAVSSSFSRHSFSLHFCLTQTQKKKKGNVRQDGSSVL